MNHVAGVAGHTFGHHIYRTHDSRADDGAAASRAEITTAQLNKQYGILKTPGKLPEDHELPIVQRPHLA